LNLNDVEVRETEGIPEDVDVATFRE